MTNFSMQETQRVLIECKNSPYCNQPYVKEACRQLFWARDEIVNLRKQVTKLEQKVVESNHRNLDLQYMVDSDTLIIEKQKAALKVLGKRSGKRGKELDEIERLQAREKEFSNMAVLGPSKRTQFALDTAKFWIDQYEGQAKHIAELEADLEYYKSGFHSERGVHERVAAILGTDDAPWILAKLAIERIAELEEENRQLVRQILTDDDKDRLIAKQRTALKKLGQAKRERGNALVEERARRICHVPGDSVGHWARYEPIVVDEAREQLHREGKL